jgi:hypothetical protein
LSCAEASERSVVDEVPSVVQRDETVVQRWKERDDDDDRDAKRHESLDLRGPNVHHGCGA